MEGQDNNELNQDNGLEKKVADASKQMAKQAAKKGTKAILKKLLLPILPYIILTIVVIVAICLLVGVVYLIEDKITEIANNAISAISDFIDVGDNGPVAPSVEEMIKTINDKLNEMGIDKSSLEMGTVDEDGKDKQTDAYLYKFMAASLSTQLPYIKDSFIENMKDIWKDSITFGEWSKQYHEVQGIVKIKRKMEDDTIDLDFMKYDDFQNLIHLNSSSALEHYTIDDSWNLCVAKYSTTTELTKGSDGEEHLTTDYQVDEVKIPYQTMISQYTIPFEFLMVLQQISSNPEYVSAVADLIMEEGEIELTIFDSVQTLDTEITYEYDYNKKWIEEEVREGPYQGEATTGTGDGTLGEGIHDITENALEQARDNIQSNRSSSDRSGIKITSRLSDMGDSIKDKVNEQKQQIQNQNENLQNNNSNNSNNDDNQNNNEEVNQTEDEEQQTEPQIERIEKSSSEHKVETNTTHTETNTVTARVTKAKVWVIDKIVEYALDIKEEFPYGEEGNTITLPDEEEPQEEGEWISNQTENTKEYIRHQNWQEKENETEIYPDKFLGLFKNSSGNPPSGDSFPDYDPEGKVVEYEHPVKEKQTPLENIFSAEDMMYTLLEKNEITQKHAELMKYLMHYYKTGEKLDISDVLSLFDASEFSDSAVGGYGSGNIDVHDESIFITDVETLKQAFRGGYSAPEKLVENAQAFLDMQNTYKVNAVFAASVSIIETGAGRTGNAINGHNNWFNIRGDDVWKHYSGPAEGIKAFGNLIANGTYYYRQGKYTVSSIGATYCPNSPDYPTQGDDWIANVTTTMQKFYSAAGINISTSFGDYSGDVVRYYQNDYSNVPYGSSTIARCGCGPTAFAMVATTLTGQEITPEDAVSWCGNAYYVHNQGTSWSYFSAAANHFQLGCTVNQTSNFSSAENALKNGKLVICSQGPGLFTSGGHYILLTKMVDGKIYVNDPNKNNAINKGYNNTGFTTTQITKAAKQYWIFE